MIITFTFHFGPEIMSGSCCVCMGKINRVKTSFEIKVIASADKSLNRATRFMFDILKIYMALKKAELYL